jgi:hypothetical protein
MTEIPLSFSEALNALLDTQNPFSPKYLHRFSDLLPESITEKGLAQNFLIPKAGFV